MFTVRTNSSRLINVDARLPKTTAYVVTVERSIVCPKLWMDVHCFDDETAAREFAESAYAALDSRGKMIHTMTVARFHQYVEKVYQVRVALEIDPA